MTNIVITWHPERERRVLLCSHYDTRPHADQEPNRNDWSKPFVSANDGTSGVAWLMELGNHVKQLPMTVGLDFVLFDGEEFVFNGAPKGEGQILLRVGAFCQRIQKGTPGALLCGRRAIGSFAGKDAVFPVERNSWFQAAGLVREIWGTAKELKVPAFQDKYGADVTDDHLA